VVQAGSAEAAADCLASAAECEQELTGISAAALAEACRGTPAVAGCCTAEVEVSTGAEVTVVHCWMVQRLVLLSGLDW